MLAFWKFHLANPGIIGICLCLRHDFLYSGIISKSCHLENSSYHITRLNSRGRTPAATSDEPGSRADVFLSIFRKAVLPYDCEYGFVIVIICIPHIPPRLMFQSLLASLEQKLLSLLLLLLNTLNSQDLPNHKWITAVLGWSPTGLRSLKTLKRKKKECFRSVYTWRQVYLAVL